MVQERSPVRLSKAQLLRRLAERSAARYGSGISKAWFDDLTKDGLIFVLDRGPNKGRSPQYFASYKHYRRSLQLKRFYYIGIKSRNAMRLQLFVRGYSFNAHEVGDALRSLMVLLNLALTSRLRSGYLNNRRMVPDAHMRSLARQFGPLDERFERLKLRQQPGFYLDELRIALSLPKPSHLLSGLLLFDRDLSKFAGEIERVLHPTPSELTEAKRIFTTVNNKFFRPHLGSALINTSEMVALQLVIFVRLGRGGFTPERFFASIPRVFADALNAHGNKTAR